MEIKDILAAAVRDVDDADVPRELREVAFAKAVDLRSGRTQERISPSLASGTAEGERDGLLARVAARFRIDEQALSEVLEVRDDEVSVIVAPSRLPRQKAAAMRDVALLVTGARQAAGIDDGWTPTEVVREACRTIGVFDSANFASEIGAMGAFFGFKGSGRDREIRVNLRGFEQAGLRVTELAAGR
jgi:hypothetical protein